MNFLRNPLFLLLALGCAHAGSVSTPEQELTPIGESGFSLAPGGILVADGFSMRLPLGLRLLTQNPSEVSFTVPGVDSSLFVHLAAESNTTLIDEAGCARLASESLTAGGCEVLDHHVTLKDGQSTCSYRGAGPSGHFQAVGVFTEGRFAIVVCGEKEPTADFCPGLLSSVTVEARPTIVVQK